MRNELETYQLIDQYLNGELPESERLAFEEKLHTDAEFAEEVDFQKLTSIVVQGNYQYHVRERVKNDLAVIDRKRKLTRWGFGGILAMLFVASISWVYFSNAKKDNANPQQLPVKEGEIIALNPIDERAETPKPVDNKPLQLVQIEKSETKSPYSEPKINDRNAKNEILTQKDSLSSDPTSRIADYAEKSEVKEKPAFDCSSIRISATPKINAACENEANGFVGFEPNSIHGGNPPYVVSMLKNGKEITNSQFYAMASADHIFVISDGHHCSTELNVFVPSKKCGANKFVFNPSLGENLQIQLKENRPYTFILRNRAGIVVYTHSFSANTHHDWNGTSLPDQHQSSDLYIYTIEYDNGQQENGQITILK